jgi:hypothetical protein
VCGGNVEKADDFVKKLVEMEMKHHVYVVEEENLKTKKK